MVAEQAGQQAGLQRQPVLRLPDVEYEARVGGTCYSIVSL